MHQHSTRTTQWRHATARFARSSWSPEHVIECVLLSGLFVRLTWRRWPGWSCADRVQFPTARSGLILLKNAGDYSAARNLGTPVVNSDRNALQERYIRGMAGGCSAFEPDFRVRESFSTQSARSRFLICPTRIMSIMCPFGSCLPYNSVVRLAVRCPIRHRSVPDHDSFHCALASPRCHAPTCWPPRDRHDRDRLAFQHPRQP